MSDRRGFTLIELLVSLAIIGILAGLLLPAVQYAREAGRRTQCQSRLRQLGLALHHYHDAHKVLPPGALEQGPSFPTLSGWGWGALILPYTEQSPLHDRIDFGLPTAGDGGPNLAQIRTRLPEWICPSDVGPPTAEFSMAPVGSPNRVEVACGNYCGVSGMLHGISSVRLDDVHDGLSHTAMLGERVHQQAYPVGARNEYTSSWCGVIANHRGTLPNSVPYLPLSRTPINHSMGDPGAFTSRHAGGAYFTFGDGSVQLLRETLDAKTLRALGTPRGGEHVSF